MMMNYTYILRCSDGTYYTGWTNDLEKRVASQMPPREKKKRSDLVIDTRGTREESAAFAEKAYRELLSCIEENQTSLEEHR